MNINAILIILALVLIACRKPIARAVKRQMRKQAKKLRAAAGRQARRHWTATKVHVARRTIGLSA